MARKYRFWALAVVLFILAFRTHCYEKTLRKIVRNQSKMVQRPFSDDSGNIVWRNTSQYSNQNEGRMPSGYAQVKTLFHKMQRPKMSTILSSVDTGRSKSTYSRLKIARGDNVPPIELRLARNTFNNITKALQLTSEESISFQSQGPKNNNYTGEISVGAYYQIPAPVPSKFFPSVDDQDLQNVERKINNKDNTIVIPASPVEKDNSSVMVKGIFIADNNEKSPNSVSEVQINGVISSESDDSKADFLLEEVRVAELNSQYSYNATTNTLTCVLVPATKADIDAQSQFTNFDIEPSWVVKRHYWDHIFDSRYEALMRSPKWPPLNVILVPFSHVDSIWKRSFENYHNNSVTKILSNVVKKLQFYEKLTFTWNEVSHLSQWWKRASHKTRSAFRKLLKSGRLEVTTGGWVQSDEATSHLFGLVHQLIEGHQWLKFHLNYTPKVGWLTNSVTHSPTLPYLLSAAGIKKFIITNLHYSWEQFLAEFQISDFIWIQNWDGGKNHQNPLNEELNKIGNDRFPKNSVLTHYMQFNYDTFKACGPDKNVCGSEFDFHKSSKNKDIHSYNIKQKAEKLLEQYSKTGTISQHNVVIAPLGAPHRYESQTEFDFQFNNYQKLSEFINVNSNIYKANINFGTPSDYFKTILNKHKTYPTVQGDFLNFADIKSGSPAYWSGFFTSRPLLKILLRRLQSTLRSTEILFTFANNLNVIPRDNSSNLLGLLVKARETVARLQDKHVVGGTVSFTTLQYVYKLILSTVKDCWHIQEVAASLLTMKPDSRSSYLQKLVHREGEFISSFRTVGVGDQIYVFNSLSQERTEIVELITRHPNIRIVDHNKKEVTIQINPVWTYSTEDIIKISNAFYKISFAIVVPPMTLELYKIKEIYDTSQSAATIYCDHCIVDTIDESHSSVFPFSIQRLQPGDIQLESYKHRIIMDEVTGFLKTVIEKETNLEKSVLIDFGAFKSSDVNAGMFLFNTNTTRPLYDILLPFRDGTRNKTTIIVAGLVTTEMTSIYGRLLQHTIKLYNLVNTPQASAIYLESKLDYELSPKNRELEIFLSITTDITNGNHPEIFTDNNGFQHTARTVNISRRVESNVYPITSMAYIQDTKSRVTLITDHAQGVTSLQEGHLVAMLDRRVLFNDDRGTQEGLADSSTTYHRHFLLLENFVNTNQNNYYLSRSEVQLPSFSASYLAESINNVLDLFVVDKEHSALSYYAFLPLIKTSFPCDVAVVNFRTNINTGSLQLYTPNVALLTLHRKTVSCRLDSSTLLNCNGDSSFSPEKILRNVMAAFHTNLVGTNEGVPVANINKEIFPPMELLTLKIFF